MEIFITITIIVLATVAIFKLNTIAAKVNIKISDNSYLNNHAKYQIALLLLSFIVLLLVYLQHPQNFKLLFSIGNISAPAQPVEWFGIGENDTWMSTGLYLSFFITLGTFSFVYLQFRKLKVGIKEIFPYIIWIIVFSLTNSFSEEAIYRLGVISPLFNVLGAQELILLSAIIFGLVHFGGMPHGLIGMLMAGFLGWFLAKSVVETEGIFWAWLIHFVQDIVIYIGFIVSNISSRKDINNNLQASENN